MIHPVARLDRWIDSHDADDLPHAIRRATSYRVEDLASAIWRRARLGESRYLSEWDLALVRVVATLDKAATRLDPPW